MKRKKDKVVFEKQQQQEQQLEYFSTIIPHRGHTLWEINIETLDICKAQFFIDSTLQGDWNWKKGDKLKGHIELLRKPGYEYVSALNKENALKLFNLGKSGSKFSNCNYLKL